MTLPEPSTNGKRSASPQNPGWKLWWNDFTARFGRQLGPFGVAVYAVLVEYARDDLNYPAPVCWPSPETIGERIKVGRTKVFEAIRKMETLGIIKTLKESRPGLRPMNKYLLLDLVRDSVSPPRELTGEGLGRMDNSWAVLRSRVKPAAP